MAKVSPSKQLGRDNFSTLIGLYRVKTLEADVLTMCAKAFLSIIKKYYKKVKLDQEEQE